MPMDAAGAAVTDADTSNNSLSIETVPQAEIIRTGFLPGPQNTTTLEAMVTNTGAAPVESMTVEVYQLNSSCEPVGKALISKNFTDVNAGSYRQVLLENVDSNVYYKVILSDGKKVLDEQMLMWMDEEATGLRVSCVVVEKDLARVELANQGDPSDARVVLAFYDKASGQMIFADTKKLEGKYSAEFELSADMSGSEYRVFILEQDTFVPLCEPDIGIVDTMD